MEVILDERAQLEILCNMSQEFYQINDLDLLLEKILTRARQCVNADAGSIYLREGNRLNFTCTQNGTLEARLKPGEKLIYSTFSVPIDTRSIAGYVAVTGKSLNLPDVYRIDADAPYQFSRQFDQLDNYRTRSAFTFPLLNQKHDVIGVLQIINARDKQGGIIPFSTDDERLMALFASISAVAIERAHLTRSILLRMIKMAEMHDPKETGSHVNRVAAYSVELYERWAKKRNIPPTELDKTKDILRMAAMLHDVGKVGISDTILKKEGKLDSDEFEIMKQHTLLGARLFLDRQSDFDEAALQVVANHHEWFDGSRGYMGHVDIEKGTPLAGHVGEDGGPRPKKGDEIHIFGRIVALADVFDALSSARCYKKPWDDERILHILQEESGTHFDPELVEIFLDCFDVISALRNRYSDNTVGPGN